MLPLRLRITLKRLALPAAIALLYCYAFPYFHSIHSANELPRIYQAMAIVDRHALDIGPEMRARHGTPDTATYRGKLYPNKAPGMSFLAVPAYAVYRWTHDGPPPRELRPLFFWLRLTASTIPSLLFLLLLARLLRAFSSARQARWLTLLGFGLGTMALVYGTVLVAHQLSAALIGSAFAVICLRGRGHVGGRALLAAGLLAGSAVLVDYQSALIGPPLFVYLIYRCRPRLRSAVVFCLGAAVPLALLLWYHWACFDHPLHTGYNHLTHPLFRQWVSEGWFGLSDFEWDRLEEHMLWADAGLLHYSPFLLLAIPGVLLLLARRGWRAEALLCAVVVTIYLYFIGALNLVSGWDVGPRYVTCALPFMVLPVAATLRATVRRWYLLAVPAGLVCVSALIYLSVAAVFPHYPDNFSNPWWDVTIRFGLAGYLPYNLGWLLGLEGLASALPYVGVALALIVAVLLMGNRRRLAQLALLGAVVAVGAAILSSHYRDLDARRQPVPLGFLPWMERIWEPRHPQMDKRDVMRDIGPRGNRF